MPAIDGSEKGIQRKQWSIGYILFAKSVQRQTKRKKIMTSKKKVAGDLSQILLLQNLGKDAPEMGPMEKYRIYHENT